MTPQPGDVVTTADGKRGIIDGSHFGMDFEDGKGPLALVVLNYSAFYGANSRTATGENRGPEYVSVSGGPCPFVPLAALRLDGPTTVTFWRWVDFPRGGGGENYQRTVNGWTVTQ